ncbi:MAG: Uncharacterised protein [Flavobacteriaceae bacterium]|nr:MAG: Uncharacterised protein [Flavobacteriaceae bacterium]
MLFKEMAPVLKIKLLFDIVSTISNALGALTPIAVAAFTIAF